MGEEGAQFEVRVTRQDKPQRASLFQPSPIYLYVIETCHSPIYDRLRLSVPSSSSQPVKRCALAWGHGSNFEVIHVGNFTGSIHSYPPKYLKDCQCRHPAHRRRGLCWLVA